MLKTYHHLTNVAEIQLSYFPKTSDHPSVNSSKDAYHIFQEFFPIEIIHLQEQFVAMYLNRANRVIGMYPTSIGGISGTVADVRLILSVALKSASTAIMLAHNHPSGNLKPSERDMALTVTIKEAAKIMEIKLLDHMIISPEEGRYYSFFDEGYL